MELAGMSNKLKLAVRADNHVRSCIRSIIKRFVHIFVAPLQIVTIERQSLLTCLRNNRL